MVIERYIEFRNGRSAQSSIYNKIKMKMLQLRIEFHRTENSLMEKMRIDKLIISVIKARHTNANNMVKTPNEDFNSFKATDVLYEVIKKCESGELENDRSMLMELVIAEDVIEITDGEGNQQRNINIL